MGKKLLVISNNAFSKVLNNGKTFESFFKGWDKKEIAQLFFSTNEYPDFEFCNNYFKMTELDILKSLLSFNIKKTGRVVSPQADEFPSFLKEESDLLKWIKKNAKTFALWRNFLWSFKTWKNKNLIKWLHDFNPDFIFFVGGDGIFVHNITQWIHNYLKIPYAVYFTDDYIINQTNENLLQWMYQKRLFKYYINTINNASVCYVVSDLMAKDYSIKFNRNFFVLVNSIDFNNFSIPKKEQNEKNKTMIFSYIGGLHLNRWKSLIELGNLLSEINSELSLECVINIYTVVCPDEKIFDQLNNFPLQFKGSLNNIGVIETIKKSDILVHVESFDKINRSYTKYSISTKIPEYMASHRSILAYGPGEVASIKILSENHIGVVLTDNDSKEEKKEKIIKLIFDTKLRDHLANKAYDFAYKNFNGSTIKENLKNELYSMRYE
jgi:glycosyltransferase involved in cell wall biosynthesis